MGVKYYTHFLTSEEPQLSPSEYSGVVELNKVPQAPGSLDQALSALEADHDFLLKGDVFTEDVIRTWIEYKREKEVGPMSLRPHPYEFFLYYDA